MSRFLKYLPQTHVQELYKHILPFLCAYSDNIHTKSLKRVYVTTKTAPRNRSGSTSKLFISIHSPVH